MSKPLRAPVSAKLMAVASAAKCRSAPKLLREPLCYVLLTEEAEDAKWRDATNSTREVECAKHTAEAADARILDAQNLHKGKCPSVSNMAEAFDAKKKDATSLQVVVVSAAPTALVARSAARATALTSPTEVPTTARSMVEDAGAASLAVRAQRLARFPEIFAYAMGAESAAQKRVAPSQPWVVLTDALLMEGEFAAKWTDAARPPLVKPLSSQRHLVSPCVSARPMGEAAAASTPTAAQDLPRAPLIAARLMGVAKDARTKAAQDPPADPPHSVSPMEAVKGASWKDATLLLREPRAFALLTEAAAAVNMMAVISSTKAVASVRLTEEVSAAKWMAASRRHKEARDSALLMAADAVAACLVVPSTTLARGSVARMDKLVAAKLLIATVTMLGAVSARYMVGASAVLRMDASVLQLIQRPSTVLYMEEASAVA